MKKKPTKEPADDIERQVAKKLVVLPPTDKTGKPERPVCGAHAKQSGQPCKLKAVLGKKRCKFHGGMVPTKKQNPNVGAKEGNAYASTPGSIYSKSYTPEEAEVAKLLKIGDLSAEIEMVRIRLIRLVNAEKKQRDEIEAKISDGMYLEVETENVGGGPNVAEVVKQYRFRDYNKEIDRWTTRLERLELSHKELTKKEDEDPTGELRIVVQRATKPKEQGNEDA